MKSPRPKRRLSVTQDHRRQWRDCLYVYPVISRRAHGVSVGVNLNIAQLCNYHCAYCQVDRTTPRPHCPVDPAQLAGELREAMTAITTNDIWTEPRFSGTPDAMRRINDIAFSGDGEPTTCENFAAAVDAAATVRREFGLDATKLIVITNATQLQSPQVLEALPILQANNGVFWAKLDAGTEEFFHAVNLPPPGMTLDMICENILSIAKVMPLVIQSLFFRSNDVPPSDSEVDAYIARLRGIVDAGGQIDLIQIHSVARAPAESFVSYLPNDQLDAIAQKVRDAVPEAPVEVTYGTDVAPQH